MSDMDTPRELADNELLAVDGGVDMQIKPAVARPIDLGLRLPQRDRLWQMPVQSGGNIL